MSGPKAADVQLKIGKLLTCLREQAQEATRNAEKYTKLGVANTQKARQSAAQVRYALQSAVTPEMKQHAKDESNAVTGLIEQANTEFAKGDAAFDAAQDAKKKAEALRAEAANQLKQAEVLSVELAGLMAKRAGEAHHFDKEDKKAKDAQDLATRAVQSERQASQLLQQSVDKQRESRDHFERVEALGLRAQSEAKRVAQVATQRRQVAEIEEQNRRKANAAAAVNEARSLLQQVEQLNHQKFAPNELAPLRTEVNALCETFDKEDFDRVEQQAPPLIAKLRRLAGLVSDKQSKWESERAAALNDLESAQQETQTIAAQDLLDWSGQPDVARQLLDQLALAQQALQKENFAEARKLAEASRQSFRRLAATTRENKAKSDQRDVIADAVMNALYEQGYDAPVVYLSEKTQTGGEDRLSDLVIFAKSPGNTGDMRMKVNLDSHVDLEVENIPAGQEGNCVAIINDLQGRLSDEVDFRMTDWGRATHHEESSAVVQEKTKVKDRVREQDRG